MKKYFFVAFLMFVGILFINDEDSSVQAASTDDIKIPININDVDSKTYIFPENNVKITVKNVPTSTNVDTVQPRSLIQEKTTDVYINDFFTNQRLGTVRISASFNYTGTRVQVRSVPRPMILQNFANTSIVIHNPIYSYVWTTSDAEVEFPISFTSLSGNRTNASFYIYCSPNGYVAST